MKKILIPALFVFLTTNLFSQDEVNDVKLLINKKDTLNFVKGSFSFNQSIPEAFSPMLIDNGPNKNDSKSSINKGNKLSVLYEKQDTVYFKFWVFTDSTLKKEYNDGKIFKLAKEEFQQLTSPLYDWYKGATVGAYTVPFRLRGIGGEDFDFESSLSLQANLVFGLGSRKSQSSLLDLSLGIGVTGANLNNNNSEVTDNRTASAFTISLGAVIKPAQYANIGIFLGKDFLGKNDREVKWIFDGKTWLGIGINLSFNELKTTKPAKFSKN